MTKNHSKSGVSGLYSGCYYVVLFIINVPFSGDIYNMLTQFLYGFGAGGVAAFVVGLLF